MANKPLKSIKFPGLPDTYTVDGGLSEEAKQALLACFRHVAWIDEHGQGYYDALESALYGSELHGSEPYWDYEWYASSESMPTGLTYKTAEFITRNDEKLLKVTNPNLDFNYVGDCELEIVGKWEIFNPSETYWNGEPQLIVVADNHGVDGKDGFKTYCLKFQNDNSVFTSASGTNQTTQIDGVSALRTYNLKFENGTATMKVDDNVIASGTGVHNNNYLNFTGIYSEYEADLAGMVIKAIKFKQL